MTHSTPSLVSLASFVTSSIAIFTSHPPSLPPSPSLPPPPYSLSPHRQACDAFIGQSKCVQLHASPIIPTISTASSQLLTSFHPFSPLSTPITLRPPGVRRVYRADHVSAAAGGPYLRSHVQPRWVQSGGMYMVPYNPGGNQAPCNPGGNQVPCNPGGNQVPCNPGGNQVPCNPGGNHAPCNPVDASAYVSAMAAGTVISVCEAFAQAVMEGCQGIDLGEVPLSRVAPDPSSFMSIVAASVTALMGAADITITVDNTVSAPSTLIAVVVAASVAALMGAADVTITVDNTVRPFPSSFMTIVAASVAALMGAADVTITVDNTVRPFPSSFMTIVAASVTALMGAADVTITVDNTESCFNGTGLYPRYTACCDPLTIPPTCPPNSINSSYSSSLSPLSTTSSSLPSLTRVTDPDACMLGTLPPISQPPEPAPSSEPSPGLSPEPAPPPPGPVVYPACPFTKEPPTIPKRVSTRCPAAANKTCCGDCSDLGSALRLVGTNLEDVVVLIDPSLVGFVDSGFKMCDMFTGGQMCEQAIEDLLCAVTCNPVGAVPLSTLITSSKSFLTQLSPLTTYTPSQPPSPLLPSIPCLQSEPSP
ncbi:unnamed protein product [Closterium sp. Naga37s-1]|nr:unnamed protein product [Closterium sp. Naga37s-1]